MADEENIVTENQRPPVKGIKPASITEEMERSYLDYAVSVIVARALPDIRDGLKPVQRRIIYAMHEQGIGSKDRYQKSAAVVGEVLKKYHPHGDLSVYDALVRMAQDFSLRYPLIDGQGNFGSLDGDSAAAMRYTECRLSAIAEELLRDIDKQTVSFADNYSASAKEPVVLPSLLPNILLNGCTGIAVGMATSIPPHNLGEVVNALIYMIDMIKIRPKEKGYRVRDIWGNASEFGQDFELDSDASVEDLMQFVKGPDFPTGAEIFDREEISRAYATGKGRIVTRAKTEIELLDSGKSQIVVSEIPYMVNKALLVAKIADLVKTDIIKDISALRDESDREGLRVVIELKRGVRPEKILNQLYKHTQLQEAYNANIVGLIRGEPRVLTLKMILEHLLKWRKVVITRRARYLLLKAREREHILLGLKIALDHLDEVIATIRGSRDAEDAKKNLVTKFKLSEIQAQAILDMQLRRLAKLERQKIEDELTATLKEIGGYEALLKEPTRVLDVIKNEYTELKEKYNEPRRTKIHPGKIGELAEEDLTQKEEILITLTADGYIKRGKPATFKSQKRGGKGVIGMETKEGDTVIKSKAATTLDTILFFTAAGKVHQVRGFEIPESGRVSRGKAIVNVLDLSPEEKVVAMVPLAKQANEKYLFFATRKGVIKRTALADFENIRRTGITALKTREGDQLAWVEATSGKDEIILTTKQGKAVRFSEEKVRAMGRAAAGVRGITLGESDEVISMTVITAANREGYLLSVTAKGFGKKTKIAEYPPHNRGGKGVIAMRITEKNGEIVENIILTPERKDLYLISASGQVIHVNPQQIPKHGRNTQGVHVMRLAKGDQLAAISLGEV